MDERASSCFLKGVGETSQHCANVEDLRFSLTFPHNSICLMGGKGIARIVRSALFSKPCTPRGLDSSASPKAHPSESLQCLSLSSATSVWVLTTMQLGGTLELWLARPRPSKDVLRHLPGGFLSFSRASFSSASHTHDFLSLLCLSHGL